VIATGTPAPFANFATEHQCRDFDAIRDWTFSHSERDCRV